GKPMPGICGIVTRPHAADVTVVLNDMCARLRHHPWYAEHRHVDAAAGLALGRVGLGFVNVAPQPASNEDGSLLAVMEGEVYDAEDHRRLLTAAGHTFHGDSQAEVLLHGYEENAQEFFRGLHGCFAAALWDGRRRRLVLVNDRFGMKPLYYAH